MSTTKPPPPPKKPKLTHHHHRKNKQFLLGGNINDPLNLCSLMSCKNQVTPKTSPVPVPKYKCEQIDIIVPRDLGDPLGLDEGAERGEEGGERERGGKAPPPHPPTKPPTLPPPTKNPPPPPPPTYNPKNKLYQYGNYNRYYGYRTPHPHHLIDPRLTLLPPSFYLNKKILDIGCNIGHITLTIASKFKPKKIIGIDIDEYLVNVARKNVKYYVDNSYPKSTLFYGSLEGPGVGEGGVPFPYNVEFRRENYVPTTTPTSSPPPPDYDLILCLSVTKWIHLNYGDEKLKQVFQRIYNELKVGGRFVLEAQPWESYKRKKKLTPTIFRTYTSIKFLPTHFNSYLASLGFLLDFERLPPPQQTSQQNKSFHNRKIAVYTKIVQK